MSSVNKKEIEKFSKMASEWWDPKGKFKPLHKFNPIRIKYIKESIIENFKLKNKIKPLNKINILDVFHCPHGPDSTCDCRKPKPGMFLKAKDKHNTDMEKSWMIGDKERDIIKKTMLSIAQIEVSVKTFWADMYKRMPITEIGDVGMTFAESEVRHKDAYARLLRILGLEKEFETVVEVPAINDRIKYLTKYLDGTRSKDNKMYTKSVLLFSLFIELKLIKFFSSLNFIDGAFSFAIVLTLSTAANKFDLLTFK